MRILLVEDNPGDAGLVKAFLDEGLNGLNPSFTLEEVRRLSTGLRRLNKGGIDVVLLDLALPDSTGLNTFLQFQARASHVPIVVFSALDQEKIALEAVRLGAQDYLVKGRTDGAALVRALKFGAARAAQGKPPLHDGGGETERLARITEQMATLTPREHVVLGLLVAGKSLKKIAQALGTSYNTVKNQRASIQTKLQAESESDLVRLALIAQFGREPPAPDFQI